MILFNDDDLILIHDGKARIKDKLLCDGISKSLFLTPIAFRDCLLAPADSDDGAVLCFHVYSGLKHTLSSGEGMLLGLDATDDIFVTLNDDGNFKVFDSGFNEVHKEKIPVVGTCCISAELNTIVVGCASGYILSYQYANGKISLLTKKKLESVITKVHLNLPFVFISNNNGNTLIYRTDNFEEAGCILEHTPASVFTNANNQNISHWYKEDCIYEKVTAIGCQSGIIRIVGLE